MNVHVPVAAIQLHLMNLSSPPLDTRWIADNCPWDVREVELRMALAAVMKSIEGKIERAVRMTTRRRTRRRGWMTKMAVRYLPVLGLSSVTVAVVDLLFVLHLSLSYMPCSYTFLYSSDMTIRSVRHHAAELEATQNRTSAGIYCNISYDTSSLFSFYSFPCYCLLMPYDYSHCNRIDPSLVVWFYIDGSLIHPSCHLDSHPASDSDP